MTDRSFDPMRFVDDAELVFDEEEATPAAVAMTADDASPVSGDDRRPEATSAVDEAPEATPGKRPRAPRRGRAAAAAAVVEEPAAAAPLATPAEPAKPDAAIPLAVSQSTDDAPRGATLARYAMPVALACSLITSLVSVGGVIAVGRSLADLRVERAHVEEEREALARVPATVAKLDRAAAVLAAAAARPVPEGAATPEDLRRGLGDLRLALDARQPPGMNALAERSASSFSELAARLDRIERSVDRPAAATRAGSR